LPLKKYKSSAVKLSIMVIAKKKASMKQKINSAKKTMQPKKSKAVSAAVFDIDKTIIAGNTGSMYVMHLFLNGVIGPFNAIRINWQILKYFLNSSDYEASMKEAYRVTKGWPAEKVRRLIANLYHKKVKLLIYEDMKELICEQRRSGRVIVFISNSWDAMVKDIADELKPDYLFATTVGISEGVYTGAVERPCYGEHKKNILIKLAEEKNIDLKKSIAYSDHISDLPMLETVGNPVAVNPDRKLKNIAEARGWKIMYPK
jgi:HAD superfamily hydrolase (TIGR01490 family)